MVALVLALSSPEAGTEAGMVEVFFWLGEQHGDTLDVHKTK